MKTVIREAINDALKNTWDLAQVNFAIEHPADMAHGDYACNVAMVIAKEVGQSPRLIAEKLVEALNEQIEYVDKIEIAGPGFINFYLSRDFFVSEVVRINTLGHDWGRNDSWAGKKVLVEYTDPNPFKEFHIGHMFTNAVGESIARLFMMNGAETKRINYQGDVGLHVAHAVWGMLNLGIDINKDFSANDLGKAYVHGATSYKNDETAQAEIRVINKKIYERNDEKINKIYDTGRKVSLAYFEKIYETLGTKFDEYFF